MEETLNAAAVMFWFGFSAPLYIHVALFTLSREVSSAAYLTFSRVLRFIIAPLMLVSIFGIAGFYGQSQAPKDWLAFAFFLGAAGYGICAWLHHKAQKDHNKRNDT